MYSEKGRHLIVRDGFKFRLQRTLANGLERWACTKNTCNAYMKTSPAGSMIDDSRADVHNHEPDAVNVLEKQRVSNAVKRKALDDVFERPNKLICRELDAVTLPALKGTDLANLRDRIYRKRRMKYPLLPQTLEELHTALENFEPRTNLQENFLLMNSEDENLVMFSTATNLGYLQQCDVLLMDGTFKSCPSLFYQLFTIHGCKNGHYLPLVFCLLPSEAERTYEAILRRVRAHLPAEFSPRIIFTDFESAIHNAVRKVWPQSTLRGCTLHLGQSWRRKIQSYGLQPVYRMRTGDGAFLRTFFGLPFLQPQDVEDCLLSDFQPDLPTDVRVREFAEYVSDTFVAGEFPPTMWASFDAGGVQTSNACEAFRSELDGMFHHAHPHIFRLMDALLKIQSETYLKMQNPPNICTTSEQEVIDEMKKLRDGNITRYEFVKVLAGKFQPKMKGLVNPEPESQ